MSFGINGMVLSCQKSHFNRRAELHSGAPKKASVLGALRVSLFLHFTEASDAEAATSDRDGIVINDSLAKGYSAAPTLDKIRQHGEELNGVPSSLSIDRSSLTSS